MAIGLLGRKVGMTQIFDADRPSDPGDGDPGRPVPRPAVADAAERDGYEAVQLGYLRQAPPPCQPQPLAVTSPSSTASGRSAAPRPASRPLAKADCEPQRFVREFRGPVEGLHGRPGTRRSTSSPKSRRVDVIGTTKGRGTAGVMKRHNFHGQRATHGVKKVHRHAGSIGCNTVPRHVFKGRRMAGQYGNERSTDAQSQGRAGRRRKQPAAGPRRRARAQRRLRDDSANEQVVERISNVGASPTIALTMNDDQHGQLDRLRSNRQRGRQVRDRPGRAGAAHQQAVAARRRGHVPGQLRQGTAKTKSRAEVAGTTKKMYRQKGTGNARAGSRRSGIRRGGGHIHAKRPRDWSYRCRSKAAAAGHADGPGLARSPTTKSR